MAFSINMAVITGNVTRDPELRYTPSGTAVCSFGVATNHSIKKDDQWTDVPTFHNIVVWGKQAEYISGVVKKGMRISLTGRIDNRQYDAKDGTKRYISEIIADTVVPFTNRPSAEGSSEESPTEDNTSPTESQTTPAEDKVEDIVIPDEMPF
jgi:single-strand DNA-binding protein